MYKKDRKQLELSNVKNEYNRKPARANSLYLEVNWDTLEKNDERLYASPCSTKYCIKVSILRNINISYHIYQVALYTKYAQRPAWKCEYIM